MANFKRWRTFTSCRLHNFTNSSNDSSPWTRSLARVSYFQMVCSGIPLSYHSRDNAYPEARARKLTTGCMCIVGPMNRSWSSGFVPIAAIRVFSASNDLVPKSKVHLQRGKWRIVFARAGINFCCPALNGLDKLQNPIRQHLHRATQHAAEVTSSTGSGLANAARPG